MPQGPTSRFVCWRFKNARWSPAEERNCHLSVRIVPSSSFHGSFVRGPLGNQRPLASFCEQDHSALSGFTTSNRKRLLRSKGFGVSASLGPMTCLNPCNTGPLKKEMPHFWKPHIFELRPGPGCRCLRTWVRVAKVTVLRIKLANSLGAHMGRQGAGYRNG